MQAPATHVVVCGALDAGATQSGAVSVAVATLDGRLQLFRISLPRASASQQSAAASGTGLQQQRLLSRPLLKPCWAAELDACFFALQAYHPADGSGRNVALAFIRPRLPREGTMPFAHAVASWWRGEAESHGDKDEL